MPWSSQIEGPSPNNTYGFKVTQINLRDTKALHEVTATIRYVVFFLVCRCLRVEFLNRKIIVENLSITKDMLKTTSDSQYLKMNLC